MQNQDHKGVLCYMILWLIFRSVIHFEYIFITIRHRSKVNIFFFFLHTVVQFSLEKEMETHSSVLAWRIPVMGEPGGLPSMGSHRVGHDWSDLAAAAAVQFFWQNLLRKKCPFSTELSLHLCLKSVVYFWVSLFLKLSVLPYWLIFLSFYH